MAWKDRPSVISEKARHLWSLFHNSIMVPSGGRSGAWVEEKLTDYHPYRKSKSRRRHRKIKNRMARESRRRNR